MLLFHELELRATAASIIASSDLTVTVAVSVAVAASDVCFAVAAVGAAAFDDRFYGFRGRGGRE